MGPSREKRRKLGKPCTQGIYKTFLRGRYPVTQEQWIKVMGSNLHISGAKSTLLKPFPGRGTGLY